MKEHLFTEDEIRDALAMSGAALWLDEDEAIAFVRELEAIRQAKLAKLEAEGKAA